VDKDLVQKLLKAAVMAPSGDNVQPWDIRVSENFTQVDLYNLPDKDKSYYNYQQSASYIAHGAVIENILIAAKHLGCHADYKLFPDAEDDNYVARISLSSAEQQQDPLYAAIFERRTNRFQYKRTDVSGEVLQALNDSVKNIDTAKVSLVNQKDKIKLLATELMVNDRIVFECKDIHQFLFDKIRWNKKQIEETRDGMPVGVMGLSFIEKLAFPLMRFWWYVKAANVFGLSRIIGLKCWWGCCNASMLGMITIHGNDKNSFVEGGRAVQRLWLEATRQGFALQPIIGLTLLINRLRQNNLDDFSNKHRQFVSRVAESLPELFGVNEEETLVMGFRAGSVAGKEQIVRTLRKNDFKGR
jgi:nitroreductase